MSQQVFLNKIAYQKAIFHCLRYLTSNVVGIFTGTSTQIKNAFPLFHTPFLNPSLEIALELIQAQLAEGQNIIGLYVSNIGIESLTDAQQKLLETIQKNNKGNVFLMNIFVLENADKYQTILDYELFSGSAKKKLDIKQHKFQSLTSDLTASKQRFIVDFDSHFQNIELDFTNSYLSK